MRFFPALCLLAAVSCIQMPETGKKEDKKTDTVVEVPVFAKGADISWLTEMESKGYTFSSPAGLPTECTALMKELGCNAVRYRVWVNPAAGWCNKDDVLLKAKRAQALGLAIMIDFHYSDSWADPGQQTIPAAWTSYDLAPPILGVPSTEMFLPKVVNLWSPKAFQMDTSSSLGIEA